MSVNGQIETSSLKRNKASRTASAPPTGPNKNLRFFGDTDLDSNPPTISRGSSNMKYAYIWQLIKYTNHNNLYSPLRSRPTLSTTLNRSHKYSQSAYQLDNLQSPPSRSRTLERKSNPLSSSSHVSRHKSSSMHNLGNGGTDEVDFRKRRHYSRSRERELDDISETGSETEEQHKRPSGIGTRSMSRELLDRSRRHDENHFAHINERKGNLTPLGGERISSSNSTLKRNYTNAPPKPARSAERRANPLR